MKTIYRTLQLAAIVLALVSCSEVSVHEDGSKQDSVLLMPMTNTTTKAAIDGTVTLPSDRTLITSAYYNAITGSSGSYFVNTTFSKSGSTWSATTSHKYWPLSGTLDIFAYSGDGLTLGTPTYNANCGVGATFTVSSNKIGDTSAGQTDIVFGRITNQTKAASGGNAMPLYHANALMVFLASSSVGYDSSTNYGITINSITLHNIRYDGTLTIDASRSVYDNCTWSVGGRQADYQLGNVGGSAACAMPYHVPATASSNPTTADAGWHMGIGGYGIMLPEQSQYADNNYPLGFTVNYTLHNGKDNSNTAVNNTMSYYYKFGSGSTWQEGKKYIYKITFTLNEILVSPTVQEWSDVSSPIGI